MLVPGDNLLLDAFEVINTHMVEYYRDAGRQLNSVGIWVTSYEPMVKMEASVQATDRNTYLQYGLDFQRNYLTLFVPYDTFDLTRQKSGDQFVIDGIRYQLESEVPWFAFDGWVMLTIVQIKVESI